MDIGFTRVRTEITKLPDEEDEEPKPKRIITSKEELMIEINKLLECYHPQVIEPSSFNPFNFKIMNQNKLTFIENEQVKYITKNLKTFKDKRKEFYKIMDIEHFSSLSQADLGKIFQVDQKTIHNWISTRETEDNNSSTKKE